MSLENNDEDPLIGAAGFIFQTSVRAKRSRLPRKLGGKSMLRLAKRRIAQIVKRVPEVMVKVTGSARGRKGLAEHMAYITRNGKLLAEKSDGELVNGREEMAEVAGEWWAMRGENRPVTARDTYNLMLSMPVGTDPASVHAAVRAFASQEFGGRHDYIFVLHTHDTDPNKSPAPQPHVHLTVRTLGLQGQYLNPKKADLQAWRERFARELRQRDVQAAATPRTARGVVQKRRGRATEHMGNRSRVNRWKVDQAIKSLQKGEGNEQTPSGPWVQAVRARRTKLRTSWGVIATALEAQGDVGLAIQVRAYLKDMSPVRFESDTYLERAAAAKTQMLAEAQKTLAVNERSPRAKR